MPTNKSYFYKSIPISQQTLFPIVVPLTLNKPLRGIKSYFQGLPNHQILIGQIAKFALVILDIF